MADIPLNVNMGGDAAKRLKDLADRATELERKAAQAQRALDAMGRASTGKPGELTRMSRLIDQATRLEEAAEKARRKMEEAAKAARQAEGGGGGIGGFTGGRISGTGAIRFGLAAGPIGLAAGAGFTALRVAEGALTKFAHAVNVHADASLTSAQKQLKLAEGIPVLGGIVSTAREFVESISGATEALRRMRAESAAFGGTFAAINQGRTASQNVLQEQLGREAEAGAFAAAGRAPGVRLERGLGAAGTRREAEQRALNALTEQRALAGIRLSGASGAEAVARQRLEATQSQSYVTGVDERGNVRRATSAADFEAQKRVIDRNIETYRRQANQPIIDPRRLGTGIGQFLLGNQAGAGQTGLGMAEQAGRVLAAQVNLQKELEAGRRLAMAQEAQAKDLQESALRVAQAKAEVAKRESEFRKAELAIQKQQLAVVDATVARLRQQAQGYGSLNIAERFEFQRAASTFAQRGLAGLTPEQIALLQRGGGGEAIGAAQERIGRQDEGARRAFQDLGMGEDFAGRTLDDAIRAGQEESDRIATKVQQGAREDLASLAQGVADAYRSGVEDLLDAIMEAIRAQTEAAIAKLSYEIRLGAAGRR